MAEEVKTEGIRKWMLRYRMYQLRWPCLLLCIFLLMWFSIYLNFDPCRLNVVPSVLSFEDPVELTYFEVSSTSFITISSKHYKDGYHSLLWRWQSGDKLMLPLGKRLHGKKSGIKIWIYRNETSNVNITISLLDSALSLNQGLVIRFNFSLNFKGWRAAWVGLREAASLPRHPGYDLVEIKAPTADISSKVIFIDLLCLSKNVFKQSRDKIVPPIGKKLYTITSFWQQTYKWSRVIPPPVDDTTPLTDNEKRQLRDLSLIEKRLLNWFANESNGPSHYKGVLKKRWESLVVTGFQNAKKLIKGLNITLSSEGILTGSPLFTKFSQFGNSEKVGGNRKLGLVADKILLPITLDYYFSTKPQSLNDQVVRDLKKVKSTVKRKEAKRITKRKEVSPRLMLTEVKAAQTLMNQHAVRTRLHSEHAVKLKIILQLLDYIEDQGWVDGSGFGSLDHEMNKAGTGFIHSLFLLKPALIREGRLDAVLKTMKWYNDFGEIYQTNFEYNGTTADRMRTILLYRLETILMSPERTIKEQREKLRDIAAYRRWFENALLVNTAFEGVFKPDLSCFHHLAIYGTAYSPGALTIAALGYYLLDGTAFSLSLVSRAKIRERLDLYQTMGVPYSLPNSISGRFPNYTQATLITMLPAYSFLSAGPQYLTANGTLEPVKLGPDTEIIKTFLRLYRPNDFKVNAYLCDGEPGPHVDYLLTIGSLEIMEAVYTRAKEANMTERLSSSGHWVLNYGAFSFHRRKNWMVSIKGFNRYVWGHEASATENVYGLYQSHGALQISNSEESLEAYDVKKGWDWTRVPGTTTVKMDLKLLIIPDTARFYQHSKLVGGALLVSKDAKLANGVFGMRFRQPPYTPPSSYKSQINFRFRKSVFFFNDLVVCLGSDINVEGSNPNRTQTTLFQDKLVGPSETSTIYINGVTKWLKHNLSLRTNDSAAMLDTNGNGYFVPKGSSLNVDISLQDSRTPNGQSDSHARYATTWLDHGIDPEGGHYEYGLLVDTDIAGIEALRAAQNSTSPRYAVIQKNSEAHVVKFDNMESHSLLYGYVFYDRAALTEGPIRNVNDECIVVAEIDAPDFSNINVSVSSPDLNFNTSKVLNQSGDNGVNEFFYMKSIPVHITVDLKFPVLLDVARVLVNGRSVAKSEIGSYVEVKPEGGFQTKQAGTQVWFKRLANGESVEAYLTRAK